MNWADFNTRHEDSDQAFEGFGRQLFSKWCNFTYDQQIETIIYVGGKGGDGGVEAFARLEDAQLIAISRSLREVPQHVEQCILELFLKNKTSDDG